MTRKDAASREVIQMLGICGVRGQFRHSTANCQLFQSLTQVLLTSKDTGHTVDRITDLYLFVGGRRFLIAHVDIPPHIVNCKKQMISVRKMQPRRKMLMSHNIKRRYPGAADLWFD